MNQIEIKCVLKASAEKVFKAWLDPVSHEKMSYGGSAEIDARIGGKYTCGDGYESGTTTGLTPYSKIQQTWRTSDFAENDPDASLEIRLRDTDQGCELTLIQNGLPSDQIADYKSGWEEYYFAPMRAFFE